MHICMYFFVWYYTIHFSPLLAFKTSSTFIFHHIYFNTAPFCFVFIWGKDVVWHGNFNYCLRHQQRQHKGHGFCSSFFQTKLRRLSSLQYVYILYLRSKNIQSILIKLIIREKNMRNFAIYSLFLIGGDEMSSFPI